MSMDISPAGASGPDPIAAVTSTSASSAISATAAAASDAAVAVDIGSVDATAATGGAGVPATPPQSVLDAVSTAGAAYERLAAKGDHVAFSADPETGEFSATLQHADGSSEPISASDALTLAAGETI